MRTEVSVPRINANSDQAELATWHVRDLEPVRKGQALADLCTSKAAFLIEAEKDGYVRLLIPERSFVRVADVVAVIFSDLPEAKAFAAPVSPATAASPALGGSTGFTRLSEAAAKVLAAKGASPHAIENLGLVSTRILAKTRFPGDSGDPAVARLVPAGTVKLLEIDALAAERSAPLLSSVTVSLAAERLQAAIDAAGIYGGSLLPIVLREFCSAARKQPLSTAYFENGYLHHYDRVNLGIALDLGQGIRVPVLKDADLLTADELNSRIMAFCLRYSDRTLTDAEMSGATVTVTDLSRQNILHFQPLLPRRHSSILGVGGDSLAAGCPLTLTLAFDHRVMNGREAASLLNQVKEGILSQDLPRSASP